MDRQTQGDFEQEEIEQQSIEEAAALAPKMIYEVIRRDGEEELAPPTRSLVWSGIAAGILISFSVLGEAIFRTYLPDTPTSFLIENLGYSFGFLLVILSGMQLFTENTLTTVLPLMAEPKLGVLGRISRLWAIVLAANVVGAFAAAALMVFTPAIPAGLQPAIAELSRHVVMMPAWDSFWRAIPAGILVAAIVWMLPQSDEGAFFVILAFTWLIAAGDFTHIVAGSVEMAYLILNGALGLPEAALGFFLPVLAGNVIGGTGIFALLVWGQVKEDV
ncbi:formate/nitrite transporter family protein [Pseudophaeobacter sp.]|uniref:formate/nitrite transporter family protein n=1 Tax=Pseudophaeobacter sp. TaxID=1971739 RepID=UPI003456DC82